MRLLLDGQADQVIEDLFEESQCNEQLQSRMYFILQTLSRNHFSTSRIVKPQNELLVAINAAGKDPKSVVTLKDLIELSKDPMVLYYYAECVIYTAKLLINTPSLIPYSDDHFELLYKQFPKKETTLNTVAATEEGEQKEDQKKRKAAPETDQTGKKRVHEPSRCTHLNNNFINLLYRAQARVTDEKGEWCFVGAALNTLNSPRFLANFNDHYAKVAAATKSNPPALKDYADISIVAYPKHMYFGSSVQEYTPPNKPASEKFLRITNNASYPFIFPATIQFVQSMSVFNIFKCVFILQTLF